ncbi:hypothetical protein METBISCDRAFT_22732 [Metschnikowia bicuspidata]|uniref:Pre-mRNA-splicing factor CWC26 n=1 Tax=Metschnikowia bicuspidata TaxID=27322 RepID=A0A4V1J373_9ASCO|nr:hypothetical protein METBISCDRAFT_22732 [Metschnikowia bicuspidata]
MSSRIDALSKYLLGVNEQDKKKKKKKRSSHEQTASTEPTTRIVIGNAFLPTLSTKDERDLADLIDPEDDDAPVRVESAVIPTANKGFKRVDTGEVVTPEQLRSEQSSRSDESKYSTAPSNGSSFGLVQGETIYRCKSGRIVDIKEKKAQMKEDQERLEQEKIRLRDTVNTGDVDMLRRKEETAKLNNSHTFDYSRSDKEYVKHMKQKQQFDDPLLAFSSKKQTQEASFLSRPVYDQGIQSVSRYNIPAGYFWDGVDRSNGFEMKIVAKRTEAKMQCVIEQSTKESYTEYDFD